MFNAAETRRDNPSRRGKSKVSNAVEERERESSHTDRKTMAKQA
jgi:hypothetical protein